MVADSRVPKSSDGFFSPFPNFSKALYATSLSRL